MHQLSTKIYLQTRASNLHKIGQWYDFVGAERELKEMLSSCNKSKIQKAMLMKGVQWSFNPPGGFTLWGVWERVIRMVK